MNVYEKAGALFLRLAAILFITIGATGLVSILALRVAGMRVISYPSERLVSGVIWILFGVALFIAARLLARLAGKGLG